MLDAGNAGSAPYFFLSYARIPRTGPDDDIDPNRWVTKLFSDLCHEVAQLTTVSVGTRSPLGFMDVEPRTGDPWPLRLETALATCRVFVPLYSRRYFSGQEYAREWASFVSRESPHGEPRQAIVPALWVPVPSEETPLPAKGVSMPGTEIRHYAEHGFYGLIKLHKFRDHYKQAVFTVARRIVEVGESTAPPPARTLAGHPSTKSHLAPSGERTLRVTVLAPRLGEFATSLDPYYYGRSPIEWTPFRDVRSSLPLAYAVEEMAASLGYRTEVRGFLDRENRAGSPEVVLVDEWVLGLPEYRDALDELSLLRESRMTILVVRNHGDDRLTGDPGGLTHAVGDEPDVVAIGDADEFRRVAPEVIRRIMRRRTP